MAISSRARKRIALLVTIILVGAVGFVGLKSMAKVQRERTAQEAKVVGLKAYEEGDYTKAINKLHHYLRNERKKNDGVAADGETWLTWVDARRRKPEENSKHLFMAIEGARNARQAMPNDVRPLEVLVDLYGLIGRQSERLDVANALLEIDPAHYDAGLAKTMALWSLGRSDEALDAVRTLAETNPENRRAHELYIQLLFQEESPPIEDIIEYADRIADANPDDIRFVLIQSRVSYAVGDRERSRELIERAAELDITDPAMLSEMLAIMDKLGLAELSERTLAKQLRDSGPGSRAHVIAAERAWKSGRTDLARDHVIVDDMDAASASVHLLGWWGLLDWSEERDGDHPALVELQTRVDPEATTWAAVLRGFDALRRSRWSDSVEHFHAALAIDRSNPLAQYFIGEAEWRLGEGRAAIDRWRTLSENEPRWIRLHVSLANLLLREGRPNLAFAVAIRGLTNNPSNAVLAPIAARAAAFLLEKPQPDPVQADLAIKFLQQYHEQAPTLGDVAALLARGYIALGKDAQAEPIIQQIIAERMTLSPDVLRGLAAVTRAQGWEYSDALFATAGDDSDDDPNMMLTLAIEAAQEGSVSEGERLFDNAIRQESDDATKLELERRRARFLDVVGSPKALQSIRELADANPQNAQIQIELLRSNAAWTDEACLSRSIQRLKLLAGEQSISWKVFEARRLLTFEPSQENASRAVLLLADVIGTDVGAVEARTLAAEGYLLLGDRSSAIKNLTEALDADRDQILVYPRLIALLQETGQSSEADRYLLYYRERDDLPIALHRRRAELLTSQGMWDEALEDRTELAEIGGVGDKLELAALLTRRGDPIKAEEIYDEILAVAEPPLPALEQAARFYALTGRVELGRATLSRAADEPRGARAVLVARFLESAGRTSDAEQMYREAAEEVNSAAVWNELARHYLRTARYDEAREAMEAGRQIAPDDEALIGTEKAIRLVARGEVDEELLDEMLDDLGEDELGGPRRALIDAMRARDRTSDENAYVEKLRDLTSEYPTYFPIWRALVTNLVQQGRDDEAIDAALAATESLPIHPEPAQLATQLLVRVGERERALSLAREWRNRSLQSPLAAELAMAQLEYELGRPRDGLRWLRPRHDLLVSLADEQPAWVELYARLLAADGDLEAADNVLGGLAGQSEEWAFRHLRITVALRDRPTLARQWAKMAEPNVIGYPTGRFALGQTWYEIGLSSGESTDFEKAVAFLDPLLADPQLEGNAAALMAATVEQLGQLDRAEKLYRQALRATPENPFVLNNLSYLLIKQNKDYEEALELAQRANEIAPSAATFLDTLATAQLRMGYLDDAESSYREALELEATEIGLMLGLADVLLGQGRPEEARQWLDRAESLFDLQVDDEVQTRLRELRRRVATAEQE